MIKLVRYKDPWSNEPEMKCFAEVYPYGEVTEPLIEKKEEGFFLTYDELRECFCRGYLFKDVAPINEAFDQWLKSKEQS